eukprot:1152265-Pelagomonas_calceolata.AAC.7
MKCASGRRSSLGMCTITCMNGDSALAALALMHMHHGCTCTMCVPTGRKESEKPVAWDGIHASAGNLTPAAQA